MTIAIGVCVEDLPPLLTDSATLTHSKFRAQSSVKKFSRVFGGNPPTLPEGFNLTPIEIQNLTALYPNGYKVVLAEAGKQFGKFLGKRSDGDLYLFEISSPRGQPQKIQIVFDGQLRGQKPNESHLGQVLDEAVFGKVNVAPKQGRRRGLF